MQQISIIGESQQLRFISYSCEREYVVVNYRNVRKNAGRRPTVLTAKPRFGTLLYCGYVYTTNSRRINYLKKNNFYCSRIKFTLLGVVKSNA